MYLYPISLNVLNQPTFERGLSDQDNIASLKPAILEECQAAIFRRVCNSIYICS